MWWREIKQKGEESCTGWGGRGRERRYREGKKKRGGGRREGRVET